MTKRSPFSNEQGLEELPPTWVVYHVPHASTYIPEHVREQFLLNDADLAQELIQMTDHSTDWLFTLRVPAAQIVCAEVSRLVIDVERFPNDSEEPMVARGMGAVYQLTANRQPLRRVVSQHERQQLMAAWYEPHHQRLEAAVSMSLERSGYALVLDCHSFPSLPLPYEMEQSSHRPQICIGTDDFHTDPNVRDSFVEAFRSQGFEVELNSPFAGALVPLRYYHKGKRVGAVMVEVRRDLYLNEATGDVSTRAAVTRKKIKIGILKALNSIEVERDC